MYTRSTVETAAYAMHIAAHSSAKRNIDERSVRTEELATGANMHWSQCNGLTNALAMWIHGLAPDPSDGNARLAALDEERVPLSL